MILKSKILLTAILAGSIIPVSSTFSGNLVSADNETHEEAIQTNTIDHESSTDDSTPSKNCRQIIEKHRNLIVLDLSKVLTDIDIDYDHPNLI